MEENNRKPTLDYIFHPKSIAVAGVSNEPQKLNIGIGFINRFHEAGFPVFPSVSQAANAINQFIQYHQRQESTTR